MADHDRGHRNTHMLAAMAPRPAGRPLILDQLRMQLAGIEETADHEVVARWLDEQTEETREVFRAALYLSDHDSRDERAGRWLTVRRVQAPFDNDWGYLNPGGIEAVLLYLEAERAFIGGLYLASLLCAHASCERVLAGCLQAYEAELDRNWRRWGLGPLVRQARQLGLIDHRLSADLERLTELRKATAHFKPPLEPNSIHMRALVQLPEISAESDDETFREVMEADALHGLRAATGLLRGDQGFARVSLREQDRGNGPA